jgi:hypothetical protein
MGTYKQNEHNKKEILKHLRNLLGNVGAACKAVGIGRTTYYNWLKDDEAFKEEAERVVLEGREELVDMAENKLATNIANGCVTSILFTLKTLGKKRGYIERIEKTGADGAPLESGSAVIVLPSNNRDSGKSIESQYLDYLKKGGESVKGLPLPDGYKEEKED